MTGLGQSGITLRTGLGTASPKVHASALEGRSFVGKNGVSLERRKGRGERKLGRQPRVYAVLDYLISGCRTVDFSFGFLRVSEIKLAHKIVQINLLFYLCLISVTEGGI